MDRWTPRKPLVDPVVAPIATVAPALVVGPEFLQLAQHLQRHMLSHVHGARHGGGACGVWPPWASSVAARARPRRPALPSETPSSRASNDSRGESNPAEGRRWAPKASRGRVRLGQICAERRGVFGRRAPSRQLGKPLASQLAAQGCPSGTHLGQNHCQARLAARRRQSIGGGYRLCLDRFQFAVVY